jgi:hypothetical protein
MVFSSVRILAISCATAFWCVVTLLAPVVWWWLVLVGFVHQFVVCVEAWQACPVVVDIGIPAAITRVFGWFGTCPDPTQCPALPGIGVKVDVLRRVGDDPGCVVNVLLLVAGQLVLAVLLVGGCHVVCSLGPFGPRVVWWWLVGDDSEAAITCFLLGFVGTYELETPDSSRW